MANKIRAVPVPGSKFQTTHPEFATMSRDELAANMKKARTWPAGTNPIADAIMAEWNGRINHFKHQQVAGESEFYLEVKQALMDEGKAEHVAANLIDTEAKMMAQARRTGVI